MQRRSPRTERHGVLRAHPGSKSLLEFGDLGAGRQPVGAQHIYDSLDVLFGNGLAAIRQKRLANRSSPVNGKHFLVCGRRDAYDLVSNPF